MIINGVDLSQLEAQLAPQNSAGPTRRPEILRGANDYQRG
nr:MAG TPA_asm: Prothrombin [Caudoviricetes sp.]